MEIVRPQNANLIAEFYSLEVFDEGGIFEKNATDNNASAVRVFAREPG